MIGLIRVAIITFLSWLFWRLVKGVLQATLNRVAGRSGGTTSSSSAPGQVADMVRDPACGSYVSMDHALVGNFGGKNFYFCSDDCLKDYGEKNPNGQRD